MDLRPDTALSKLHRLLAGGRAVTLGEASEELNVSKRHVRRLIRELRENGLNCRETWEDGQKQFYLAEGSRFIGDEIRVQLTEKEALALTVAGESARAALRPTPLSEPLVSACRRLLDGFKGHVYTFEPNTERRHWHFGGPEAANMDPEVFRTVSRATTECRSVRVDYLTASTGRYWENRKIDPLVLAVRRDSWLLSAYCHIRQEVRDFSLAGIDRAELCDPKQEQAYFAPPEDFDPETHFRDRFGAVTGQSIHVVRIQVASDVAEYFRRKSYHPTQQIEKERADGSLIVSFEVDGLAEVKAFIRSWGPEVLALEPTELVDRLRADAQATLDRYQADQE